MISTRRPTRRSDTECSDCGTETLSLEPGVPTEYYMVHDSIWADAGMRRGFLCIGCLERRIGRKLNRDDFTDAGTNDLSVSNSSEAWSWRSERLIDRLTTPPADQLSPQSTP